MFNVIAGSYDSEKDFIIFSSNVVLLLFCR